MTPGPRTIIEIKKGDLSDTKRDLDFIRIIRFKIDGTIIIRIGRGTTSTSLKKLFIRTILK